MKPSLLLSIFWDDDDFLGIGPMGPGMKNALILLGTLLLVVFSLLVWASLIRKRRHGHHRHHHHHGRSKGKPNELRTPDGNEPAQGTGTRHRRHRRREHRPLNPTLAMTGGLPPVRNPEPPRPVPHSGTP